MWKRIGKAETARVCPSTGGVEKLHAFSTACFSEKVSTGKFFFFHRRSGENTALAAGVDIGLDGLHGFGKGGVLLLLLFHLLDGIQHRGVVPVVKLLPKMFKKRPTRSLYYEGGDRYVRPNNGSASTVFYPTNTADAGLDDLLGVDGRRTKKRMPDIQACHR